MGADHLNVHLCVINVPDLKRAVSMAGRSPLQFEIEGRVDICGAMTPAF